MTVGIGHVLALSAALLAIGTVGVLARRSLLGTVMAAQLMLTAPGIALVGFARFGFDAAHPLDGAVLALLALGVGAGELAVGVALALLLHRRRGSDEVADLDELRG